MTACRESNVYLFKTYLNTSHYKGQYSRHLHANVCVSLHMCSTENNGMDTQYKFVWEPYQTPYINMAYAKSPSIWKVLAVQKSTHLPKPKQHKTW